MPHVIAVSGPIGGGKSSLVKGLAARLGDAVPVFCDSYEKASEESAKDIVQWMAHGANYDELSIVGLAEDLERLQRGQNIRDPQSGADIPAKKYVVLETNFGREHRASAQFIDLLIWIDVPLEIALARKLKQFTHLFVTKNRPETYRDCLLWMDEWLANYLRFIRDLLHMQTERVRPRAELILDGRDNLDAMIEHAYDEILRRFSGSRDRHDLLQ